DYWWFVGRRAIIGALVRDVVAARQRRRVTDPSLQLLDIGCGTGANLPLLGQLAGDHGWVTGVDFSPLALQFARDHLGVRRLSLAMSMMPPIAYLWRRCVLPFLPKQPRDATRHSQGAVLPPAPGPFNRALIGYLEMEGRLIVRRPLRFGTSLVGIAVKPE